VDGPATANGGAFCTFADTSFSQNLGRVGATGVMGRCATIAAIGIRVLIGSSLLLAPLSRLLPNECFTGARGDARQAVGAARATQGY
jgi:xanthine/uracil permease